MAGLFGGARRFLADQRTRGNFADRLSLFGAQLQDINDGGNRAVGLTAQRAAAAAAGQKSEANRMIGGLFGGRSPAHEFDIDSLASGNLGMTDTEAAQQPAGLPTMAQAAPILWQAAQMGGDIGPAISMIDKSKPSLQVGPDGTVFDANNPDNDGRRFANRANINNFVVDMNNPENEGRHFPTLTEGQTPLYDAQGNIVAVRNLDGSVQAQAERAGAIAAAQAASTNPYELATVMGPDGRPITASRQAILGGGPIYGQSEGGRAYDVKTATGRAERENAAEVKASAASSLLPSIDRMETLLPDVIAGPGAGARLAAARAMGAAGNRDAQRKAAATEVFQAEGRQLVSQIIGSFGTNPTEGERMYAERMAGADVTVTPQALQEGLRLTRARAMRDVASAPSNRSAPQNQSAPSREALLAEARRRGLIR